MFSWGFVSNGAVEQTLDMSPSMHLSTSIDVCDKLELIEAARIEEGSVAPVLSIRRISATLMPGTPMAYAAWSYTEMMTAQSGMARHVKVVSVDQYGVHCDMLDDNVLLGMM